MKSDYTTNSCYITHAIAFWKVGRIHFLSSGVKGLMYSCIPCDLIKPQHHGQPNLLLSWETYLNWYCNISTKDAHRSCSLLSASSTPEQWKTPSKRNSVSIGVNDVNWEIPFPSKMSIVIQFQIGVFWSDNLPSSWGGQTNNNYCNSALALLSLFFFLFRITRIKVLVP